MAGPKTGTMFGIKLSVLGLAIAAYFSFPEVQTFVYPGFSYLMHHDFEGFRGYILSFGIWAPLSSILLMALQSMVPFIPGLAITVINAWVFGWKYGALYSWMGALLGAVLDYMIARWYGRPFVERLVRINHLEIADRFFHKHGVLSVLITRLTPLIPFKMVSYGAGLTSVPFSRYALATAIGQTPAIVLYSWLGQHLTNNPWHAAGMAVILLALGALAFWQRDKIEQYLSKD